mmetsp:Transcript_31676/g.38477  ORF Transcript_31676/g.38477 Transcript_31676/m.38477 type:complete len:108 (+) Transcript_31676:79-402(+)
MNMSFTDSSKLIPSMTQTIFLPTAGPGMKRSGSFAFLLLAQNRAQREIVRDDEFLFVPLRSVRTERKPARFQRRRSAVEFAVRRRFVNLGHLDRNDMFSDVRPEFPG